MLLKLIKRFTQHLNSRTETPDQSSTIQPAKAQFQPISWDDYMNIGVRQVLNEHNIYNTFIVAEVCAALKRKYHQFNKQTTLQYINSLKYYEFNDQNRQEYKVKLVQLGLQTYSFTFYGYFGYSPLSDTLYYNKIIYICN